MDRKEIIIALAGAGALAFGAILCYATPFSSPVGAPGALRAVLKPAGSILLEQLKERDGYTQACLAESVAARTQGVSTVPAPLQVPPVG